MLKFISTEQVDLMIVIGTDLKTKPFNELINKVECPQVLLDTKTSGS